MTESDFQTEVLTTLRKLEAGQAKLEAGQAKLSRELCEFREDMGARSGNQWQVNQNIEKHLRTLTGDARLAVLA